MAEVVGGFLMPHNPMLTSHPPGVGNPEQQKNVFGAFEAITKRVKELEADTVIIIGDDHYTNFGPHCIPRCLIVTGDVDGPIEPWIGLERGPIENNEALANHILRTGYAEGIDWAFAKALTVDHSVAIPYHLAVKNNPGVKAIPVYLNDAVPPLIESRRAFEIGQSMLVPSGPGPAMNALSCTAQAALATGLEVPAWAVSTPNSISAFSTWSRRAMSKA